MQTISTSSDGQKSLPVGAQFLLGFTNFCSDFGFYRNRKFYRIDRFSDVILVYYDKICPLDQIIIPRGDLAVVDTSAFSG